MLDVSRTPGRMPRGSPSTTLLAASLLLSVSDFEGVGSIVGSRPRPINRVCRVHRTAISAAVHGRVVPGPHQFQSSSTVTLLSVRLPSSGREGTGRGVPVVYPGLFRPAEHPADFLRDPSRTRW